MRRMIQSCLVLVVVALTAAPAVLSQSDGDCSNELMGDATGPPSKKFRRQDLYRGQQAFTVAMLEAIQKSTPNENIFFSPYSTYHALLLAFFGSRSHTNDELTKALRIEWPNKMDIAKMYHLEKENRAVRSKAMPLEFGSADKIFYSKEIEFNGCTAVGLQKELEPMDFRKNADQSRQQINEWIAKITRNEIPEMLNPGDVSTETQIILANAAYFKGMWANQFDPKDTKQEVFYTTTKMHSFVPMMHKSGTFNLAIDETLGAYVLQMPFLTSEDTSKSYEISMIVMLPPFADNSLEKLLTKLTPDSLDSALREMMPREIDISLPKFEFEQSLELMPILQTMGVKSMFEASADFTGFSNTTKISFGDAKHVAKIKVDEEGSTAAAATVLFSFRSARPIEPTKFQCDHPFLFLIYDHNIKAILFAGIYRDPKTQK